MLPYMLITVLLLTLAGLAVLNHAFKGAPTGYEDEFGFHAGNDAQRAMDFATGFHSAVIEGVERRPKNGTRTRRILKRVAKQSVDHGSAVPFPY